MFVDLLDIIAEQKCLLDPYAPIVLGVSGGADSLALLIGMKQSGFNLIVAHLNHCLREESGADAAYVQELAIMLNLPFVIADIDVRQEAREKGQSLEEAAREVRYNFLFDQARQRNAQAVATAHHADDQVETILMNFLRGAGLSGLSGMDYRTVLPIWDPEIPLVRPLLSHWRKDIDAYLAELRVEPVEDLTNADQTYFRNRLRHTLIPELETYNPRFKEGLQRMALVLGEEDRFLNSLTDFAWKTCVQEIQTDRVTFVSELLKSQPIAIQRRLLRRAAAHLQSELREIGFEAVERALEFVENDSSLSNKIDWVSRLNLVSLPNLLIVKTWEADLPDGELPLLPEADFKKAIHEGESIALQHGWQLTVKRLSSIPSHAFTNRWYKSLMTVCLDAESLEFPLELRSRERGERWHPMGWPMEYHMKVSEYMINIKLPAHLRARWPLVCSGGQIAWVVGVRPAEPFKITEKTKAVVQLQVRRISDKE